MRWVTLPVLGNLTARVRADQVMAITPPHHHEAASGVRALVFVAGLGGHLSVTLDMEAVLALVMKETA